MASNSKQSGRKRSVITLEQKLKIISDIRGGKSQRCVAEIYQTPKSTVGDIWKDREKIERHVSASDCPSFAKKRCIVREAKFEELDKACYTWFMQQRSRGAPVSGPLLKEKALQLFPTIYPDKDAESFMASSGWLHNFCSRHGIRGISLQGESLSADTSAVELFQSELRRKMKAEDYSLDQVFNADETGLWWKLMPSKSLVHCGETQAKNFKEPKDRVTLLGCSNASGTCKLPLVFIHKSAKPRCFKHMDMNTLPVHYFSQPKAWMDARLFETWFHEKFVPHVKKFCHNHGIEYKVLLLLDNAPAHPSAEKLKSRDGKVTTMFLPPNTTSILQPMDQGILEATKRRYKKCLLRHLILENDSSSLTVPEIVRRLTIKDAVYWSSQAWEEANPMSLMKAWNKLIPSNPTMHTTSDVNESLSSGDFHGLFQELGYSEDNPSWQDPQEWLNEDSTDPGYQLMTDAEIVADVTGERDNTDPESDDEMEPQHSVSHAQAFDAFEIALRWLEGQSDTDPFHLLLVRKWRDTAAQKRTQTLKQTTLFSYLTPKTS